MRGVLLQVLVVSTLSAYRAVPIALYAQSWRLLIPGDLRPRFAALLRLRWIGEAINSLVPIAQVGGDVVRARLLARQTGGATAATAMVADLSVGVTTQALFGIAGLGALTVAGNHAPPVARTIATVLVVAVLVAAVLTVLLRRGTGGLLGRLRLPGSGRLAATRAAFDVASRELARRPRDVAKAAAWHLAGWFSHVLETWIALALFLPGGPSAASWPAALAIEGVSSIARAAAFFVPGGLGVQEGSILYLCHLVGLPVDAGVSLAVAKRMREIVVGALGLAAWAIFERASLGRLLSGLRAGHSRKGCADV